MTHPYEFHFDFLSPNAYLAHRYLPKIEERHGIKFEYVPVSIMGQFKLTNNKPSPVQLQGIRNKPEYIQLEMRRFIKKHGINYSWPKPFPFKSKGLLAGAVLAMREGVGAEFIETVFHAAYEQVKNMDDIDELSGVISAAGLDADKLLAADQDDSVLAELEVNLNRSVERGTFGSPSIFIGDELFFGKDRFQEIEEEIMNYKAAQ